MYRSTVTGSNSSFNFSVLRRIILQVICDTQSDMHDWISSKTFRVENHKIYTQEYEIDMEWAALPSCEDAAWLQKGLSSSRRPTFK